MAENTYRIYQEGLIKTLLATPEQLSKISNVVTPDDFADTQLRIVYESIQFLAREKEPVSLPGIVSAVIRNYGDSVKIDPNWILSLDSDITKWTAQAPVTTWAKLLKTESARNRTALEIRDAAKELQTTDPVSVINKLSSSIEKIAYEATATQESQLEQSILDYKEYMKSRLDVKENIIPSPYPSIDKHIVGWLPKQLVTIGARTSVGKSVIATQSAVTACVAGKSVMLFSLEMSEFEVMDRMLSSMSMVELGAIRTRGLDEEEQIRFDKALDRYSQFKLQVDETPNVTIDYIREKAMRRAQSPEGLDMVIIDYLQLITNNSRSGVSRQEQVAEISRNMKILAKQLNIPVMVLVQLNREDKNEPEDRLPKIADIRESGAIAADSDVIILIDRKLDNDSIDPKALFIIGKNRNGQTGKKISVRCSLEYAMFTDDKEPDPFEMQSRLDDIEENYTGNFESAPYSQQTNYSPENNSTIQNDNFSVMEYDEDENPFSNDEFVAEDLFSSDDENNSFFSDVNGGNF